MMRKNFLFLFILVLSFTLQPFHAADLSGFQSGQEKHKEKPADFAKIYLIMVYKNFETGINEFREFESCLSICPLR